MTDFDKHFHGKKITVMGLGLLGRGVGDVEFLARHGAELIVTDLKNRDELAPSLERLKEYSNIVYTLGGHTLEDFENRDFILKAAGVPLDSLYLAEAKKNNIPVKMSASWFAELSGIKTVGVTGTRGKTTVTYMLHDILVAAGIEVLLGGNVQGISTLALLDAVTPTSVALMELDSWQLQGWRDSAMSPHVSVFTTFFPDHLNYYHNDIDAYLEDKAAIFTHQTPEDTLVVGTQVMALFLDTYKDRIVSNVIVADGKNFPEGWKLSVIGDHNRENAMCALEAARAFGIEDSVIKGALESFKGVPGRLEFVGEKNGVQIYNDTTSTTPEATLVALTALKEKSLILIMGGNDKHLDTKALTRQISLQVKKVVLIAGTGTETIKHCFPEAVIHDHLEYAVREAFVAAEAGDVILFSPAFTSFGMFKNEYDRGEQFMKLVRAHEV